MKLVEIEEGIRQAQLYIAGKNVTGFTGDELRRLITVRQYGNLTLLNYTNAAQYEDQWTPFLRVCRGLVLHTGGQVVSFPFHKFFNLGEMDETSEEAVSQWSPLCVTEKVDGVLIQVFKWEGNIYFASRHGIWTDASRLAFGLVGDAIEN